MRMSCMATIVASLAIGLSCLNAIPSRAASDAEIARLRTDMKYWSDNSPMCPDPDGDFLSKEYDYRQKKESNPNPPWAVCNDGDAMLFSGLLCSVGHSAECKTVKRSQDQSGKWWRSPRNARLKPAEGGTETNFSNDHAAGVWLYILHEHDVDAFKKWAHWIEANAYAGFIPEYCRDQRCAFKLVDCPVMDRVALSLGVGNDVCDSVLVPGTLPQLTVQRQSLQTLKATYGQAVASVKQVPGASDLLRLDALSSQIDKLLSSLNDQLDRLDTARVWVNTVARAASDSAGIVERLNSVVNDAGYPRHDVAVAAYILLKYGGIPSITTLQAARSVAAQDPENAFFEYVAHGKTDKMLADIFKSCRATGDVSLHPRFQWIWERDDRDTSNPKAELMYSDCLFVAQLYLTGSMRPSTLPELAGAQSVFLAERTAFETAEKDAGDLIETIHDFKKHPADSAAYLAQLPAASGMRISQGAAEGALKGLGVPPNQASTIAKILVPAPPRGSQSKPSITILPPFPDKRHPFIPPNPLHSLRLKH